MNKFHLPKKLFNSETEWAKVNYLKCENTKFNNTPYRKEINYNFRFPTSSYDFPYFSIQVVEFATNEEAEANKNLIQTTGEALNTLGEHVYSGVRNNHKRIVEGNRVYAIAWLSDADIKKYDLIGVRQFYSAATGWTATAKKWYVYYIGYEFLDKTKQFVMNRDNIVAIFKRMKTLTTTKTYTLGPYGLSLLTDEDKKIATDKGWTLA